MALKLISTNAAQAAGPCALQDTAFPREPAGARWPELQHRSQPPGQAGCRFTASWLPCPHIHPWPPLTSQVNKHTQEATLSLLQVLALLTHPGTVTRSGNCRLAPDLYPTQHAHSPGQGWIHSFSSASPVKLQPRACSATPEPSHGLPDILRALGKVAGSAGWPVTGIKYSFHPGSHPSTTCFRSNDC